MKTQPQGSAPTEFGIETSSDARDLQSLLAWIRATRSFHPGAEPTLPLGYFANVVPIDEHTGVAISTDGVGTKILVAQAVGRYDTVGVDCVAMNANDLLCVGAKPISMVDYIAVEEPRAELLEGLARGLSRGCELARINVPGGELAHLCEMLRGARAGYAFDMVGTCIGTVPLNRVISGAGVEAGDVVLGLASDGLHSNGFTLARHALIGKAGLAYTAYVDELGCSLGEELLRPTRIYVPEILRLLATNVDVRGLMHMTGGGLWNLTRTMKPVGFRIEQWPEPPPIFRLIQSLGEVPDAEAFSVFNMGIGFCVVVPQADVDEARRALGGDVARVHRLGVVTDDPGRGIEFLPGRLVGAKGRFGEVR